MTSTQKVIKMMAICLGASIIVFICGALISAIVLFTNLDNKESTTPSKDEAFLITSEINRIKIDVKTVNLRIAKGQNSIKTNGKVKYKIDSKNGVLEIKEENTNIFKSKKDYNITVYLEDKLYEELEIDSGAGKIEIENIKSSSINIDQGTGLLKIVDGQFKMGKIEGGVGKIEVVNSSFRNLVLESGVGKVSLNAKLSGISKIENGVGSLDLLLIGSKEDYSIIAESLKNIKLEGKKYQNNLNSNKENIIKIENGLGKININFSK